MTATCPAGHTSSTDDFCDVCGTPIPASTLTPPEGAAPAPSAAAVPSAVPGTLTPPVPGPGVGAADPASGAAPTIPAAGGDGPKPCPNCQAENAADALFCEDCGYDFATGQLPPPPEQIDPLSGKVVSGAAGSAATPGAAAPAAPDLSQVTWVAEIWVDRDWFAHQQAEGNAPTSGVPTVAPLPGDTALIGRRSASRGITPEVDCTSDGAISHRHAELRLNGEIWSVQDLGSTNGTFVGRADGNYPENPLPAQQPHELGDGERVYLGAWTRIVVRKATDDERRH